jgi:two-component system, NarL family, invasion response regulator UvrY
MKTIMLVDDHMVVRAGYQRLIENEGYFKVICEVESAEEVLPAYRKTNPDLVMMDITLPDGDGIEVSERLIREDPEVRILIVSLHDNVRFAEKAIKSGVLGYVTKSCSGAEIMSAARAVVAGKKWLSPDIASKIALQKIDGELGPIEQLTAREQEIFIGYAEGYSVSELARRMHLSEKTISNNISNIKSKLGIKTTAEFVHLAVEYGLLTL